MLAIESQHMKVDCKVHVFSFMRNLSPMPRQSLAFNYEQEIQKGENARGSLRPKRTTLVRRTYMYLMSSAIRQQIPGRGNGPGRGHLQQLYKNAKTIIIKYVQKFKKVTGSAIRV